VQIEGYRKRLWNPEKRLLAHIRDDGERRFKDENLWGVGNGWAVAGITRVIRRLPRERRDDQQRLARFVKEIVDGCLAYQRADGLFHNMVDQPETFIETNLAQMLAFGFMRGCPEAGSRGVIWLARTGCVAPPARRWMRSGMYRAFAAHRVSTARGRRPKARRSAS